MHYYKHNIGDYRRRTSHLSLLEHGIYRQLLDQYYLDEIPLISNIQKLERLLCVRNADEKQVLCTILEEFFELTEDGYIHPHADKEISKYHEKSDKAAAAAAARWDKVKEKQKLSEVIEGNAAGMQTHSEGNANHKPITTNHKPIDIGDKSPSPKNAFSDEDNRCAEFIFSKIRELNPTAKPPNMKKWAESVRLMRERDNRTHREIIELFTWANNDQFWKTNILSPQKLREKWDSLVIKKNNQPKTMDVGDHNRQAVEEAKRLRQLRTER